MARSRLRSSGCAVLLAMLLSACGTQEPAAEPERPARRPPQQACDQARAELNRETRGGDFLFEESGSAMVDRTSWLRMARARQDEILGKLAVLAGCSAETPQREVEVSIRTETGEVIETRRLPPSVDFRAPPS